VYTWAKQQQQQAAPARRVDSGHFTYDDSQSFDAVLNQPAAEASSAVPPTTPARPAAPGTDPSF
jgi:hypothetical protein